MMDNNDFLKSLIDNNQQMTSNFPKKIIAQNFINQLTNFLFPVCKDQSFESGKINVEWEHLKLSLKELLIPIRSYLKTDIDEIVRIYFDSIPAIYNQLVMDAKAINEFDPASFSVEEIILAYPGFQAILTYRLSHPLYELEIPILPRLLSEYAHTKTGIDINPGAQIGKSFFIDHGTGIVIGETTIIGDNVKIYQGVTLGALSVKKEEAKTKRHPTIEDNVIIYSGTTVLGGKTIIGHDSIVGGNVWLTKSIEPFSMVHNISEIKVRNGNIGNEPLNFVI
jgi:serine O-acetyltransferase